MSGEELEIDLRRYFSPPLAEHFSSDVLHRAYLVGELGRMLRPLDAKRSKWLVGSITSSKTYTVFVEEADAEHPEDPIPSNLKCTCPNGSNKPRPQCYHAAAVLIAKGYGSLQ